MIYWHSKKNYMLHLAKKPYHIILCGHKLCLNDAALRTVGYLRRLSTAGKTLLCTESVSCTNITVHIPQCVTVMNRDTLQHFPTVPPHHHFHTQDCISQTVWSDLKAAPVLKHWYIYIYIKSIYVSEFLVGKRFRFTYKYILSRKGHLSVY